LGFLKSNNSFMTALNVDISISQYQVMLGVGGIGSGTFFELNGEHTLGREESRSGHYIDRRDYCKLHIISHYVKVLLGESFSVLPIGMVGKDEIGQRLLQEMNAIGLDLRYVQVIPGVPTLYSFCFLYPGGSGGNLTTDNSACALVGVDDISRAKADFIAHRSHGVALAVPEVNLSVRQKLLQLGTEFGFWRVAALTSAEILPAFEMGMLAETDLLALNLDEAAVLAEIGTQPIEASTLSIVEAACAKLEMINSKLKVTITAGKSGSWSWDGENLKHLPAIRTNAISTAGAGDAFLAGVISAWVAGLDLYEAQQLGTLVAAKSVTSPHTIDPQLERGALNSFAIKHKLNLPTRIAQILYPL
jgi:ribokinase